MGVKRQKRQHDALDARQLFSESAAGIQISGDSGTGKTELLKRIMETIARAGFGYLYIDPDGDGTSDATELITAMPNRIRRRLLEVKPSDTRRTVAVNPLAVPWTRSDEHGFRARRSAKVSHFRSILFAAWGESEQGINGRPQLAKISDVYLNTLAECGLTVPDVECFFDVTSDVYRAIVAGAPGLMERLELAALADMKPREREEAIASTKNRFIGFLQNPIVRAMLGNVDGDRPLDFSRLRREQAIVHVNLDRAGLLRDEDVHVLANLFLHELLFAAYNTPRDERAPYFVILDELPDFQSCAGLLIRALRHVRKYQLRFICAHQGTHFFQDRTDDRLLRALVGQCRIHYFFRHADPVDAKFFGDVTTLPDLDPKVVKHVQTQEQQFQVGHDLVLLEDESENWQESDTTGSSNATANSDTTTDTAGHSEAIRQVAEAIGAARQEVTANTDSRSRGTGTTLTATSNSSQTRGCGGSRTKRQTLVPRLVTKTVVTGIQFYSLDELRAKGAVQSSRLGIGQAVEFINGRGARVVQFTLAKNPFRWTPQYGRKKRDELEEMLAGRTEYSTPQQVLADRRQFLVRLADHLRTRTADRRPAPLQLPAHEPDAESPFAI
ncbi:MAG: hypothetical protein AB7U73_01410 [Pirellulales bacterium]